MKVPRSLALMCLWSAPVLSQVYLGTEVHNESPKPIPIHYHHSYLHPFIEIDGSENGGGYSTFSAEGAVGVFGNTEHLGFDGRAFYNNARKTNDGSNSTHPNHNHGHSAGLEGTIFYRLRNNWLVGGGAKISRTFTTDYTKQGVTPKLGFAKDLKDETFPARLQALYLFPARNERTRYPNATSCKCTNGSQGVELSMSYPTPASSSHFLFHGDFTFIIFHTTITDPNNPELVRSQGGEHHTSGFLKLGIVARW
jgi:hypothetical protein